MKAISIRQPWAWLIVFGDKDIENRTWKTHYRGQVLIHASKTFENEAYKKHFRHYMGSDIPYFDKGGIIGIADLVDCVTESDSRWFTGPFGFILENVKPLPFKRIKGRLRLFDVEWVIDSRG